MTVNGTINVTGGNAATSASVYSVATTSANNAYNSAVSTASGSAYTMATTSANTAYTNASASAYTMATTSANTAYTNAKAVADSIAAGTYSGGTYIDGKSIISPIVAGANGYFSQTFKVGNGGITLDGVNKLIYVGAGNYANADTAFYVDNSSNFSLGSKLTWNGSTLSINGNITATNITAITSGNIAGWITDASTFKKSDGTYTTSLNSSDSSIKITLNSTQQDKIKIYPADSIPPITTTYADTITFNKNGGVITSSPGSNGGSSGIYTSGSSGRSDTPSGA